MQVLELMEKGIKKIIIKINLIYRFPFAFITEFFW